MVSCTGRHANQDRLLTQLRSIYIPIAHTESQRPATRNAATLKKALASSKPEAHDVWAAEYNLILADILSGPIFLCSAQLGLILLANVVRRPVTRTMQMFTVNPRSVLPIRHPGFWKAETHVCGGDLEQLVLATSRRAAISAALEGNCLA